MPIAFRPLQADDRVTGLSLGSAEFTPLKTYLQKHARDHQRASLARTYVALDDDDPSRLLLGYVTLVAGEIAVSLGDAPLLDGEAEGVSFPYLHYPAIKIARLAVDKRARGRSIGRDLVSLAVAITKLEVAPAVGCRFLVTDAKSQSVPFYLKCGFTLLDTAANTSRSEQVMFIDIHKLSSD